MLKVSDLTSQMQNHFAPQLLEQTVNELRLNEFGQQKDLPKNLGSKAITFHRRRKAVAGSVQTLTEGDPTALTKRKIAFESVEATLVQKGDVYEQSDVVGMVGLFNFVKETIPLMGEEAALDADSASRDALVGGLTGGGKRYGQGLANFAALAAASASAGALVGKDVMKAVTQLRINKAPKINGYYVGILPPQGSFDFMNDADWKAASQYSAATQLFKGEMGMWHNCRMIECTNPFIEGTAEGTYDGAGAIYTSLFLGKNAFGTIKLAGTSSPWKPQCIINDKADKSDPLNQLTQIGYKMFWVSKLLNAEFVIGTRHKSTFV